MQPFKKPALSYVALIYLAIANTPDQKARVGDICNFIQQEFPYYKGRSRNMRRTIYHTLSHNDCFVKDNPNLAKCNYWKVHSDAPYRGTMKKRDHRFIAD